MVVLQEGESYPGPESGLLSNIQKLIVWGDTRWQSKRLHWQGAPRWKAGGEGKPGGLLRHAAHSLRFYDDEISFRIVSGQSVWLWGLWVLPGRSHIA